MLYDFESHPCCLNTDIRSCSVAFPVLGNTASGRIGLQDRTRFHHGGILWSHSFTHFLQEISWGKQNKTKQTTTKQCKPLRNESPSKSLQSQHPMKWGCASGSTGSELQLRPSTTWVRQIHQSLTTPGEHRTECFTQSAISTDLLIT